MPLHTCVFSFTHNAVVLSHFRCVHPENQTKNFWFLHFMNQNKCCFRVWIHLKILYSNFLFIHHEAEVGIWFYIVKTAIQAEICVAKCLQCGAFCSAIQSNSHRVSLTQNLSWSLGRSIALQLQHQTDLLLCTIVCFPQWDRLQNMAVGDLAFYYLWCM